jgi:hypothetical protein
VINEEPEEKEQLLSMQDYIKEFSMQHKVD